MPKDFYTRLREYYSEVAKVLRGDANAASVFPNPTDVGIARSCLRRVPTATHPSKCNVSLGGFLFHANGQESRQMDVIITTDVAPRFDFHNRTGSGKSFSPVEGTIGVTSVKSKLDRKELIDALDGLASIPPTEPLGKRIPPMMKLSNYEEWPYKIVFAHSGINGETILQHIRDYYASHPEIPVGRRPDIVHVAGQYLVMRLKPGMSIVHDDGRIDETPTVGNFRLFTENCDLLAIAWVVKSLQEKASATSHINFGYGELINQLFDNHSVQF
ncbi:MAG: DUF6602 domain-containing protein [Planctomycetaceae bacterium]